MGVRYVGPDGLNERQRIAVQLLARGHTLREVAKEMDVSEKTLWNWRKKPAMQRAIMLAQQEITNVTDAKNLTMIPNAIRTLEAIVNSPQARDSDRIQAARVLLNGAQAYTERKLLERQIRDLEDALSKLSDNDAASGATTLDPITGLPIPLRSAGIPEGEWDDDEDDDAEADASDSVDSGSNYEFAS